MARQWLLHQALAFVHQALPHLSQAPAHGPGHVLANMAALMRLVHHLCLLMANVARLMGYQQCLRQVRTYVRKVQPHLSQVLAHGVGHVQAHLAVLVIAVARLRQRLAVLVTA
jgi:hypothetical protein